MRPILLASALLLAAVTGPTPAAAQDTMPRSLTVSGTGTADVTPDRATLILAVETQAQTAQEAARLNAQRMDAVIAAVRRAGVPQRQIRTANYRLHPEYRHEREREPTLVGYRAGNQLVITIDSLAIVGQVIDLAIGAGANRVDGLGFGLRDVESARQEALRRAVQNARATAETIAAAAGVALGEPWQIAVGGGWAPPPTPMPMRAEMAMDGLAAVTPVEPGQVSFSATVSVTYRLLP
jgi:uncharacterized protein